MVVDVAAPARYPETPRTIRIFSDGFSDVYIQGIPAGRGETVFRRVGHGLVPPRRTPPSVSPEPFHAPSAASPCGNHC